MDPDTDVAAEMDELRSDKEKLAQRVEELEKMLVRKSVSLMGALQACDDITIAEQRTESELQKKVIPPSGPTPRPRRRRSASSGLRESFKAFQQYRKSQQQSSNHSCDSSTPRRLRRPSFSSSFSSSIFPDRSREE